MLSKRALLVAAMLGVIGSGQNAVASGDTHLERQFQIRIRSVLKAKQDARTFEEWLRTGLLPAAVFDLARSLSRDPARRPRTSSALCSSFLGLSGANLALFETMLKEEKDLLSASCQRRLLVRIRRHWQIQREDLAELTAIPPQDKFPRLDPIELGVSAAGGPVLFNGGLSEGVFALTFDDGPDGDRTPRLASALSSASTRATFFPVGIHARRYPEVIRDLFADGHSVGSHTWSHPLLTDLPLEDAHAEIRAGAYTVEVILGESAAPFFRFPYGARNSGLQDYVRGQRMATFFWNLDSLDWKIYDTKTLYHHLVREIESRKRGIILMHADLEQTVIVAPYLLNHFHGMGIRPAVFVAD